MLNFLWFVRCSDDLPTATAHIRAAESGRHTLIARGEAVYEWQTLTKAKKKMFGNEPGDCIWRWIMTALQEAGGELILLLAIQADHPRGRAHQVNFTAHALVC